MDKIYLRHAKASDMDIFYAWRNEEKARKNSFSEDWIKYVEHEKWFLSALQNSNEEIWVLCTEDVRLGQIRLTYKECGAYLSYSIAHEYRGQGYGKLILQLLENEICDRCPKIKIIAQVKKENVESQAAFRYCGYKESRAENSISYEKLPSKFGKYMRTILNSGGG